MKFLCVECDQAMKLLEAKGPDRGSLTVVYKCPTCERRMALLTNPWETQVVRSMDVKIGGRSVPAEPMAAIKESLASAPKKCPFPGVAENVFASSEVASDVFPWTKEAEQRLSRIPDFVRPMAKVGIEKMARDKGYEEVNDQVMNEAKDVFGM